MTRIYGGPAAFAREALAGFCDLHAEFVHPVDGGVIRSTRTPEGKVALVVGGGSGHYPAFAGYVGPGLADGAAVGEVFTSPSTARIVEVARRAQHGGGVLLAFGNYAGDVLNFGAAARQLATEGIAAQILPVTDDIASASADERAARRGIAGNVVVYKIAGAAAEAGYDLDDAVRVARLANDRTRSLGVAFAGVTLPGKSEPLFTVEPASLDVGLGIHGEPGISTRAMTDADGLARLLVDRVLAEAPAGAGTRITALLNGLGATKYEELFLLWGRVARLLAEAGLEPVAPIAGEFVTSLDMAGCSLTVSWLDDELERLWLAPADSPALHRGTVSPADRVTAAPRATRTDTIAVPAASECSAAAADRIAEVLSYLAHTLAEAEAELAEIDTFAGDGDHGEGMVRGSRAAVEAARAAVDRGAGASTTLLAAADAWAAQAGGTSGALWGIGLRTAAYEFSDDTAVSMPQAVRAARAALNAVVDAGGAVVGDKTLVDALEPLVRSLETDTADRDGARRWADAAAAATAAARDTARLTPRLGRARPLAARSIGHPDAGAVSLALCATAVGKALAQ
ncbi:dihydroxyacetone kinase family protein [Nocardia terpenica]|uniref:D-erythrulose kinase n=1 Tax=Nocardia terpenica TaxID=455432 RepID=A0A164MJT2_9NOCA|nr:dihydroxyacetone kinase family protein [Nocardia terpenica]KZM73422.1 D-erythrulose kinase [Nocardia terpenica]NQE87403.1 dihydroxyacetone kinase family protein [Nocardia terpenica]